MARSNPKHLESITKSNTLKTKLGGVRPKTFSPEKKNPRMIASGQPKVAKKQSVASSAKNVPSQSRAKPISPKLVQAIQQKTQPTPPKKKKGFQLYSGPRGRRGRRPKGMEGYTPLHQDEDAYVLEPDYEAMAYDTGIKAKQPQTDDSLVNVERFEEFDEELDFDW